MSSADKPSRKSTATIGLAIVGILVSGYLEVLHVQTYLGLGGGLRRIRALSFLRRSGCGGLRGP